MAKKPSRKNTSTRKPKEGGAKTRTPRTAKADGRTRDEKPRSKPSPRKVASPARQEWPAPRDKAPATAVRPARPRPQGPHLLQERWPVMLETAGWEDYALLDMGDGEKLERYGSYTIRRPEPQAMGARRLSESRWENADAAFTGDVEEEGPGRWRFGRELPETWPMAYGPATFNGRFMSFRHVGVFPEQASHWDWVSEKIAAAHAARHRPPVKVLNLFGYTGLASLLPASIGAEVTHVDASKKAIGWARENQELSGLGDKPIRWICEDAMKFIAREVRRGNSYDGVILDPPKFGRGPSGEVWNLFDDLPEMLDLARAVLSDTPVFALMSIYAIRASFLSGHELMADVFHDLPGTLESGELVIRERPDDPATGEHWPARALSTSLFSRWSAA
ncbi:class I SAM-dependent methyltransferase [Breoghania sp. L-A4]|uniref:class I SAM-dependent methyltransferase n=1 Tax=Breoghania sp. L-A4 TaxID=2304600 RepID=UPI001966DE91